MHPSDGTESVNDIRLPIAGQPVPDQPVPDQPKPTAPKRSKLARIGLKSRAVCYRYPMALFAAAWIIGTFLASQPGFHHLLPPTPLAVVAAASLLLGFACRRVFWLSSLLILASILLVAIVLALYRAPNGSDSLSSLAQRKPQAVALRGIVLSAAAWSPSQYAHGDMQSDAEPWLTQWTVGWTEIRNGLDWRPIKSRSKLLVPGRIQQLLPGDEIEVFGSLRSIEAPPNPGMVDFAKYARREDIYVSVKADDVSQIRQIGFCNRVWPSRLRGVAVQWVDSIFERHIPFGQAPLAAALVLGQREQVDWELQQQLMATGTIHMLAISGMHVEMIAGTLLIACVLLSMRPRWMFFIIVGVSLFYAGLAGGRPPVMRAVVLVLGTSMARYWGVQSNLFNLLGLAAMVLILLDPDHLYNPGVHLSFLAVGTIGVFHPSPKQRSARRSALRLLREESMNGWYQWLLSSRRSLWDAAGISTWVCLMTCPIIWFHFNLVSPIAVPLNVVLGLPLMIGLLAGLITAVFGWLAPLGWLFGGVSGGCLRGICWLVEQASRVPLGHFWLPAPPVWWVVVFYAIVAIWLGIFGERYRKALAALLISWVGLGILLFVPGPRGLAGNFQWLPSAEKSGVLTCTFLDVGHGTCVLMELPDGRLWMYDAGRLGDNRRSFRFMAPSVWAVSAARIDTLIISHADADHYNAVRQLLKRFSVGQVASTEAFWNSRAAGAVAVREVLDQNEVSRQTWSTETNFLNEEELTVEVLHPTPAFRGESDNADSLCLRLEYSGTGILLSGDIEGSGLLSLCEMPPRNCQIMMAPHHGSLSHDTSGLLQWCRPRVIVISGGERAMRPAVIERYSNCEQLGITFRDGAIRVSIDPDGSYQSLRWDGKQWIELLQ